MYVCDYFITVMETTDALGRRRQPSQNRGLRPLYARLPQGWRSRLLRIAMSEGGWRRLDELLHASAAESMPRAVGELLEDLLALRAELDAAQTELRGGTAAQVHSSDWQLWQKEKELNLLRSSQYGVESNLPA